MYDFFVFQCVCADVCVCIYVCMYVQVNVRVYLYGHNTTAKEKKEGR